MVLNRAARRREKREHEEQIKVIEKLTPTQTKIMNQLAMQKAEKMISNIGEITDSCLFKALRNHGVSEKRANIIINETGELIELEAR